MSLNIKLNFVLVYRPLCIYSCILADFLCSKIKLACAFFVLVPATECVSLSCKLSWVARILIFFNYLFSRSCPMSLDIKLNLIGVLCPLCIDSRVFADFLCSKVKFVRAFFFLVPAAECIAFGC